MVTGGNARGVQQVTQEFAGVWWHSFTAWDARRGRVVGNLLRRDRNPVLQLCAVSRCGGAVLPVASSLVPPHHRGCGYAYSRQC